MTAWPAKPSPRSVLKQQLAGSLLLDDEQTGTSTGAAIEIISKVRRAVLDEIIALQDLSREIDADLARLKALGETKP